MNDPTPDAGTDSSAPTETVAESGRDPFDRLAEEFAERCRKGESPSIGDYEARYPELAEKIRKYLPTVALMEQLKRGESRVHGEESARSMPERLGEFRVLRELGRGGMGVVYEAVQESLGRHVALKVIHHVHLTPKRLERFQREARAVAQLHHTNIVPIFGVGEHAGLPYYVMQFINGSGLDFMLKRWRRGGAPSGEDRWRSAARIGAQAAFALQYAHDQGILHRDIKPANLLIDEHLTVWITDFGLAKLTGYDDLTASGDVIGTLRYLAPEALRGETDARSDVYSLGMTLYELLTLTPPFGELSPSELLRHVSEGELARPRRFDPLIPRDLETIVLKATAREPIHRYPTAGALADDLRFYLEDHPIRARRATAIEQAWRWSRRNRALAALAATAVGSMFLAAVVGSIGYASTVRALGKADDNVALSLAVFEELFDKLAPQDNGPPPPTGHTSPRRPPLGEAGLQQGRGQGALGPGRRPDDAPPGPPRQGGPVANAELLQSVLTFYERFALRNETNPRLQSEAARAYFRVGTLCERLGRAPESARAHARAIDLLERLIAKYPRVAAYRAQLVEIAIMTDPWSADLSSLPRLEQRLRRAQALIDQLVLESPGDVEYAWPQLHVHAKLGAVLQRLNRLDDAESYFRRAIALAGSIIERAPVERRPRLDRADMREALAELQFDRGLPVEARTLLDEAVGDLESVSTDEPMTPSVADRFEKLGEAFEQIGEPERAREIARRVADVRARRGQDDPGRGRSRRSGPIDRP